jgi:hypothetical protein
MPSAATATAAQHLRRARDVPARTANRGDPQPLTAGPNTIDLQKHSSGAPHPNPSWSCGFDSRHRPPKPRSSIEPHRLAVLSLDETDLLGAGAVDSTGIPARNLFSPEYYPAPTGNAAIAGNSRTGMGSAFSAFRERLQRLHGDAQRQQLAGRQQRGRLRRDVGGGPKGLSDFRF